MSQHAYAQNRIQDLSIPSIQQPGRILGRRPVGIAAGHTAILLTALCLFFVLFYAVGCAYCARHGYTTLSLRREIEDLRAQNELLRYQINLSQSNYRVDQAAQRLEMHAADPAQEVDYVVLPTTEDRAVLAEIDPVQTPHGFTGVVTAFADQVVGSAGGHAEASTGTSHRP